MQRIFRNKRIYLSILIISLLFCQYQQVFALTYQQKVGVSFTFNPTIRLTLSSPSLTILNLAPGASSDSNQITVNVFTNSVNGYTLTATVGNSSIYNYRDLKNNTDSTKKFSSLDYGSSLASLSTPNTWGYSYSTNGSTWSQYSGLPLWSDTTNIATLKSTNGPVSSTTGDNIGFKINAYADATQPTGEYRNVINFKLTGAPVPATLYDVFAESGATKLNGYYKMQDMTSSICSSTEVVDSGSEMQLIDERDNTVYWVTKLQDGNCWMTQNLDLNLSMDKTLTSEDTDLNDHSLSGAYSDGYTYDSTSGIISWTPSRTSFATHDSLFPNWSNSNSPYSLDVGNWYTQYSPYFDGSNCSGNSNLQCDYLSVSPVDYFSETPYAENGAHGHVGNYYNWAAAIASNDISSIAASTYSNVANNPQNSICPAGWRLPIIGSSINEYQEINNIYNTSSTTSDTGLVVSPLYFNRTGQTQNDGHISYGGLSGVYWTSTKATSNNVYRFLLRTDQVAVTTSSGKYPGRPIRCIAK